MNWFIRLLEKYQIFGYGEKTLGAIRSSQWPRVRKEHLNKHPYCEVCGGEMVLEVHHKLPFHLHPELELDPNNLITLCESGDNGMTCHLAVGHLGSYKSFNKNVDTDARVWANKIHTRP